ncbi:alpha/beta hydrolase [Enterococcus sp. LJL128]|uniref:alpha/beta hydrolase n=1 Tax=Enterococcus sp. LJL51 TaxID=3416656 RepID=UPI003CF31646
MPELLTLSNGAEVSIFIPKIAEQQKYLLYFHGGGLVYGSKNDLPEALKSIFLSKGYTVLAIDYLLAPNSSLKEILQQLQLTFLELKERRFQDAPYSFCGRSAGSYLMLLLTSYLQQQDAQLPDKLINFYGYFDLNFITNERKLTDTVITEEMIQTINQTTPQWDDPLLQRYLLYLYAIQNNRLESFYGLERSETKQFSLSSVELQHFPKIFSTASTDDLEVPFKYSKQLARFIPNSKFIPVYSLEHDFLKQMEEEQVKKALQHLDTWLDS